MTLHIHLIIKYVQIEYGNCTVEWSYQFSMMLEVVGGDSTKQVHASTILAPKKFEPFFTLFILLVLKEFRNPLSIIDPYNIWLISWSFPLKEVQIETFLGLHVASSFPHNYMHIDHVQRIVLCTQVIMRWGML